MMAVPLAAYKVKRDKERELRYALREIRKAIDNYKDATLAGKIEVKLGTEGYPESLEILVQGVKLSQSPDGKTIKFLRRATPDKWQVSQHNPPEGAAKDFALSRKEWQWAHRVIGKYAST